MTLPQPLNPLSTGKPTENISSLSVRPLLLDLTVLEGLPRESRSARYRQSNDTYRKRESERDYNRDRSTLLAERQSARRNRPFIGWDTEGENVNATPFLFGSSAGDRIAHESIGSAEIFDLILSREKRQPDAIHIIYGGEYDFNMFIRDLTNRQVSALAATGKVEWNDYKIEHIPRKWFTVRSGPSVAKVFDVVSFFGCKYADALLENNIGSPDEQQRIIDGKSLRSGFSFADIGYIEPYWRTELKLLPELMNKMRDAFYGGGMFITSWHGPGALARFMLKQHGVKNHMASTSWEVRNNAPRFSTILPERVHDAARYAFCGGRFEGFSAGIHKGTVYNADVNSAYPYAATLLPSLSVGSWVHVTGSSCRDSLINPNQFALYHIRYRFPNADRTGLCVPPLPLFRRYMNDAVMWPQRVTGWYWGPEAWNVRDDPHAEFLEAWVLEDTGERPFSFLQDYYRQRALLKSQDNPIQIAFKLAINSVYGQTAQRAGWQRRKGPPPFHQIESAGFITSVCRAMIYRLARKAWDDGGLISIDTDGVFSTTPLAPHIPDAHSGGSLGQWGTSEIPGILFWQSGVYWIPDTQGNWTLKKARGAPKGEIDISTAHQALGGIADDPAPEIHYRRNEFVGYRWALRNHRLNEWRHFVQRPRTLRFGGSAFSKRNHNPRGCRNCRGYNPGATLHDLSPIGSVGPVSTAPDFHSKMHSLPWEVNDHERPRELDTLNDEPVIDSIFQIEGE